MKALKFQTVKTPEDEIFHYIQNKKLSTLIWLKNDRYHIDGIFWWRIGKSVCQLMHLLKWEQARQNENVILEPNSSGKLPPGST